MSHESSMSESWRVVAGQSEQTAHSDEDTESSADPPVGQEDIEEGLPVETTALARRSQSAPVVPRESAYYYRGEAERAFRKERQRLTSRLSSQLNHAPPFYHHWLWGFRFSTSKCEAAERRLLQYNLRPGTDIRSLFVPCGASQASCFGQENYFMHTLHLVPPSLAQHQQTPTLPSPSSTSNSNAPRNVAAASSLSLPIDSDSDDEPVVPALPSASSDSIGGSAPRGSGNQRVPLVLGHGFGGGVGIFIRQYQMLYDNDIEVYSFDWLGMGRSSKPSLEFPELRLPYEERQSLSKEEIELRKMEHRCMLTEEFFCTALEEWRKSLGLERFILLGHSLGGYLAACYALRYPDHIARLILASPIGIPPSDGSGFVPFVQKMWDWELTPQQYLKGAGPFGPYVIRSLLEKRGLSRWFSTPREAELFADYLFQISSSRTSGDKALFALLGPGAHAYLPLVDRLTDLSPSVPIDVVFGTNDWVYSPGVEELRVRLPPDQFHLRYAGGDHHLYLDPHGLDVFNELLLTLALKGDSPLPPPSQAASSSSS